MTIVLTIWVIIQTLNLNYRNMKYVVQKIDGNKTTAGGKAYHKLDLLGEDGKHFEGVAMWQDNPDFSTVSLESLIEGDVVEKQNGQFTNRTIYPPRMQRGPLTRTAGGGFTRTMDLKKENIREAQENKEHGIMTASSMNLAVQLAIAEGVVNDVTIVKWRRWILNNWELKPDDQPPF